MYLLYGVLIGLALSAVDIVFFTKEKNVKNILHAIGTDTVVPNLIALYIGKNSGENISLFTIASEKPGFTLDYILYVLLFGLIALALRAFLSKSLAHLPDPPKDKKQTKIIRILSLVFFTLGSLAIVATIWAKQTFGDITADQMLINLKSPTEGTSMDIYLTVVDGPLLSLAVLLSFFCMLLFSTKKLIYIAKSKEITILSCFAKRIIALVLSVCVLVGGITFGVQRFGLHKLISSYIHASSFIEDNYADPDNVNMEFPETKRNLIFLYLESVENTFFSKELGGALDVNVMPDYVELSKEGYSFSHLPDKFGGPAWSTGAGWSVAAMVNMFTGMPMKVPYGPNDYGTNGVFLPGITAMGDILHDQGYEQTIMFGADAKFGGLDVFYTTHGNYKLLDYAGAKAEGLIPEDYYVWWGYEDDKLFELAKNELTRLSETGKPFNLTMETADTHAPNGWLSPNAPKPFESQYSNCLAYSSSEVTKFVHWIQEQPFYDNTTIVIIGDHQTMANQYIEDYVDPDFRRSVFNLIINPDPSIGEVSQDRLFNRDWATFDMFPTVMASLGVKFDGDHLGIGTNLFSDSKTVFEEYGIDEMNKELERRSTFYENNFLVDPDK